MKNNDKILMLNNNIKNIFIFIYILFFSFDGNCLSIKSPSSSFITSPSYRFMPGNIYHSSSKSSDRIANSTYVVDDVYIEDINTLMLNTNDISAIWYQYDFQCSNHPDGKSVEFGSDSHGKWYSSIPKSTGYIGYSGCNFKKKLHYICCQVNNKKYKIEFTQQNFNALVEKIGSKFKLETPNEKDFPCVVTKEEKHDKDRARLTTELNYWNDSKNSCIKYLKLAITIAIASVIILMIAIQFTNNCITKQLLFSFMFLIVFSCLFVAIIQFALYLNFSEYAEYFQIRLKLLKC